MHAVSVQNRLHRIVLPLFCFVLLLVCVLAMPSLSLPLALLMPLMVCPAQVVTGLWFSLLMASLPCVGLLSSGADLMLALCALPFSCLSLLVSFATHRRRLDLHAAVLWHFAAMLVSLGLLCAGVSYLLGGGDLFHSLAAFLTDAIANAPNADAYLYSIAQAGLLPLSPQTEQAVTLLRQYVFLIPAVKAECLNALRFQLFDLLRQGLPQLLVQLSLTVGLFTALHTAREDLRRNPMPVFMAEKDGKSEPKILALPTFRAFYLPLAYRRSLLVLSLLSLLLFCFGRGEVVRLVSVMMFSTMTVTFSLLGAAVWVFLLCRGHTRRVAFAGATAGALFLLYPNILFILGLADQLLHIRVAALFQQDHKEG